MLSLIDNLARLFPKSTIHEFFRIFGPEDTRKLLAIFGGTTIRVPSTEDLELAQRDLYIYEKLKEVRGDGVARRKLGGILEKELGLSRRKLRLIYRAQRKLHKEAEALRKLDEAVGRHKRKKIRVLRRKRGRI